MSQRLAILLAACLVALCALPSAAGAVLSGRNGRIVYTSGPPFGATKLFLRSVTSSTGGGSVTGPLDTTFTDQYRHPTWSPDRSKIAFAEGPGGATGFDIYILDLTTGVLQNITQSSGVTDDRPAWSPDGTRIAYESGNDIIVHPLAGGTDLNLTSTLTPKAWKVAWSPDSQTVYYSVGDITQEPNGTNNDIRLFQQPADNSSAGTELLHVSGAHVFQPSISPDGTKLCYTLSLHAGNSTSAEVVAASLSSPAAITPIAASGKGDYNCTWSPDGTEIAYAEDYAGNAEIFMTSADGTGIPINLTNNTGVFDGNPDWAPDGPPVCPARTVQVFENTPTTITLQCNDTGPAYEQTPVRESVANDGNPTHGTLSNLTVGTPSTVVYTPNANFLGGDAMKIIGFDDFGFGTDEGTITIDVVQRPSPPPGGTNGAPVISKLRVSRQIKKAGVLPHLVRTPRPTIRFTLSEDATVTLSFARALPGTRVRRHGRVVCVKLAPGSRKRCVRYVGVRTKISLKAKQGVNRVVFYGRLSRRRSLSLGTYRLTAVARDAQGGVSKPKRARFRLVRPH
jgi:Big-like domain-containing protein/WD40 repeat protein